MTEKHVNINGLACGVVFFAATVGSEFEPSGIYEMHWLQAGELYQMAVDNALYIVATPIGNLDDISARALKVLTEVHCVAAEDTRHSARLLDHFGITTPLLSYHEHGGSEQDEKIVALLRDGNAVALISDAGTPLISDPGFPLVNRVRELGIRIVSVPGPCALVAALAASGLPCDRFCFEGFLPAKSQARKKVFEGLRREARTLVFYEAPHRICDSLRDALAVFGPERQMVLAREISKTFETYLSGRGDEVLQRVEDDAMQQKGEMVLMLRGWHVSGEAVIEADTENLLKLLLTELPVAKAAALCAKASGVDKRSLYNLAMSYKA